MIDQHLQLWGTLQSKSVCSKYNFTVYSGASLYAPGESDLGDAYFKNILVWIEAQVCFLVGGP